MIKKIEKFGAIWCQHCKILEKTLDKIIKKYPDIEYVIRDADSEEDAGRFEEMHIKNIPHTFFFDEHGYQVIDTIGAIPFSQIDGIIKDNLNKIANTNDCENGAE